MGTIIVSKLKIAFNIGLNLLPKRNYDDITFILLFSGLVTSQSRYIKEGIPFKHGLLMNMPNSYLGLSIL